MSPGKSGSLNHHANPLVMTSPRKIVEVEHPGNTWQACSWVGGVARLPSGPGPRQMLLHMERDSQSRKEGAGKGIRSKRRAERERKREREAGAQGAKC